MKKIIIIKFGGSVLTDLDSIKNCVSLINEHLDKDFGIVIVVSALKGKTDNLVQLAKNHSPSLSPKQFDAFISNGERESAKLFVETLSNESLDPVLIDPDTSYWPIITDDVHLDANPLVPETESKCKSILLPMIENGSIPVVCGFIGKTKEDVITTLGRGGSDTTAVLLGASLDAVEVLLVKDVANVFTSDPNYVDDALPLKSLTLREASALSFGGAKFLHRKCLQYKSDTLRIRILSIQSKESGTIIDGSQHNLSIGAFEENITMVTIIGVNYASYPSIGGLLSQFIEDDIHLLSLALESDSLILYLYSQPGLLKKIHSYAIPNGFGKAISTHDDLSGLHITGPALDTTKGLIQKITAPLSEHQINVYGIVTVSSSIQIYVSKNDISKTIELLKSVI
uniref:Aspartate kinase (LysC) n=1 Tax=uncultured marine thaumarchaeote AD1000_24_H07 TaxID=1455902 RepID=A0A075FM22_9ARCH|nr:aspartate kinase (lysC) [uncultured marine thaumarchaeote AD1000_24_H07]